ncbi:MAG: hypothetical protein A2W23_03560 [Planctomycetes bacterium RBG_16_43_13]|nr:MAG: hypothetical protein A2W23_03560 [Planctomycetes bacterium RBG_16_43_13]
MSSLYRRTIGVIIAVVIFYFIGKMAYREWDKISGYDWSPSLPWFIASIFLLLCVYLMGAYGWTLVLRMLGTRIAGTKGISIMLLSLYGRYVPGGVWAVLGRVYLCRLEGIPDSRSGMSILLEQSYQIVSAGLVFAISLLFWADTGSVLRLLPLVFIMPFFVAFLHPKPFLKIVNPVLSRLGRGAINFSLSFNKMLILAGYYLIYWIVTGIAFFFFIRAFYPLDIHNIPVLIGIFAISFAAGYLAFFTPAGLGVREGALTFLLSLFIPMPIAIGVSLLSRLWLISVEIVILVIFLINRETRKMAKTALGW